MNKLSIIGIFYIIFGLLGILGLPMIWVHQTILNSVFENMPMADAEFEQAIMTIRTLLETLVPALIALVIVHILANVAIGYCFIKKKLYNTCLVASIFTCLFFPFGTILGVFSLMALIDEGTKKAFGKVS
ncbi:MAG: hypothetical protein GY874_20325 [Desulfobacteraceae bacterium]|nr:hypothetical protein [Desulfobacteraceae bacterium]